jgi:hypothetical protein
MTNRVLSHVRSNVIAYVALFAALGGTSYAAVRLAPGSVTTRALANGAVTGAKLAPHSVSENNVVRNSLTASDFKPGVLRGVVGLRGPAGPKGSPGTKGDPGQDGNGSVVLRSRGTDRVVAPHGASTDVPLTGTSWTQGANDLDLVTGSMQIETPGSCTGSFGNALVISVDGVPTTFALAPTFPANSTLTVPVVVSDLTEPGASRPHTITAKLANTCTKSGEDYTVSNAKIDVLSFH